MTKRERAAISIIIGGLAGGIILLDTGLAHRPDVGAGLPSNGNAHRLRQTVYHKSDKGM